MPGNIKSTPKMKIEKNESRNRRAQLCIYHTSKRPPAHYRIRNNAAYVNGASCMTVLIYVELS